MSHHDGSGGRNLRPAPSPGSSRRAGVGVPRVPGLTVAAHPDVGRVGERVALPEREVERFGLIGDSPWCPRRRGGRGLRASPDPADRQLNFQPPAPAGEDASGPRGGERLSATPGVLQSTTTINCLEPGTNFGDVVRVVLEPRDWRGAAERSGSWRAGSSQRRRNLWRQGSESRAIVRGGRERRFFLELFPVRPNGPPAQRPRSETF
jgi:hypothetical protein